MTAYKKIIMMANQKNDDSDIIWNQLVDKCRNAYSVAKDMGKDLEGRFILTGDCSYRFGINGITGDGKGCVTIGHKYLIRISLEEINYTDTAYINWYICSIYQKKITDLSSSYSSEYIIEANYDRPSWVEGRMSDGTRSSPWSAKATCYIHDLTLMFGEGNEPITVNEFYRRIEPFDIADINAYNSGEEVLL